jgi:hypothetical protein
MRTQPFLNKSVRVHDIQSLSLVFPYIYLCVLSHIWFHLVFILRATQTFSSIQSSFLYLSSVRLGISLGTYIHSDCLMFLTLTIANMGQLLLQGLAALVRGFEHLCTWLLTAHAATTEGCWHSAPNDTRWSNTFHMPKSAAIDSAVRPLHKHQCRTCHCVSVSMTRFMIMRLPCPSLYLLVLK